METVCLAASKNRALSLVHRHQHAGVEALIPAYSTRSIGNMYSSRVYTLKPKLGAELVWDYFGYLEFLEEK
jgi:hypothetical protein